MARKPTTTFIFVLIDNRQQAHMIFDEGRLLLVSISWTSRGENLHALPVCKANLTS